MAVYPPTGSGGTHMDKAISGGRSPKKQAAKAVQPVKKTAKKTSRDPSSTPKREQK